MARHKAARKTGRPPADHEEKKSIFVGMKLNAEEADLIRRAAKADERAVSAWVRVTALKEARRQLGEGE